MLLRTLQGLALAATLGACADIDGVRRGLLPTWLDEPDDPTGADTIGSGRQAARSIWGVVPVPPPRKTDLRPEMIEGSAVAVAGDTLLANCAVLGGRARVGLVRHNKYRIARVAGSRQGAVCRLVVDRGPLTPVAGWRSFADLRLGEPVVVLASRTSAEVAAAPGWRAGKGDPGDPFLEVTAAVPASHRSAVLVDGFGHLIGLGAAAPLAGALVLAAPIESAAAPEVANQDLGSDETLVAALTPNPRAQPIVPPVLLALGGDERDHGDRPPADRRNEAAADEPAAPAEPGGSAGNGGSTGNDGTAAGTAAGGGAGNGASSPGGAPTSGGAQAPDPGPGSGTPDAGGTTVGGGGGTGATNDEGRGRHGRGRGGRDRDADGDDADHGARGRGRGGRDRDRSGEDGGRGDDD